MPISEIKSAKIMRIVKLFFAKLATGHKILGERASWYNDPSTQLVLNIFESETMKGKNRHGLDLNSGGRDR